MFILNLAFARNEVQNGVQHEVQRGVQERGRKSRDSNRRPRNVIEIIEKLCVLETSDFILLSIGMEAERTSVRTQALSCVRLQVAWPADDDV